MERVRQSRLLNLMESFRCSCILCELPHTPEELYDHSYNRIDQQGMVTDRVIRVFGQLGRFGPRQRANEYTQETLPLGNIMRSYERYNRLNLEESDPTSREIFRKTPIYRQCPLNYEALTFLNIRLPIRPGNDTGYQEVNDIDMIARGDETTHYNRVLRSNFIFSFLFRSMELQVDMLGFFNGPLNSRFNDQVPTTSHFTRYWMQDWSWIQNLTCSLDTWVQSLNEESNNRFLAFLTGFKHAIEHFKRQARLDDIRYWLDELDDSRTYVRHLQMYATGQNMLFLITYNALQHVWKQSRAAQVDLAKLLQVVISK